MKDENWERGNNYSTEIEFRSLMHKLVRDSQMTLTYDNRD